jgi:ectoine hydroxylase-related dioxygenase (phytanoyl-CoA dioxygenase family)
MAPAKLNEDGFEILASFFPIDRCSALANGLSLLHDEQKKTSKNRLGGLRNLLRISSEINELANSRAFKDIFKHRLNKDLFPVRALFFDKTPDTNWQVPWHQDLTIAVAEKIEVPEFEAWSVKEEIIHVQPPCKILEGMATLRLHLDNCDKNNGALKVIPRSHTEGKLDAVRIKEWTSKEKIAVCEVSNGGALLMRPLLLHSSSPSKNPSHRRVLHIEYASNELPGGLKWFERQ